MRVQCSAISVRVKNDAGRNPFAPKRIWYADNANFFDRRVGYQHRFYLFGVSALSAAAVRTRGIFPMPPIG